MYHYCASCGVYYYFRPIDLETRRCTMRLCGRCTRIQYLVRLYFGYVIGLSSRNVKPGPKCKKRPQYIQKCVKCHEIYMYNDYLIQVQYCGWTRCPACVVDIQAMYLVYSFPETFDYITYQGSVKTHFPPITSFEGVHVYLPERIEGIQLPVFLSFK